MNDTRPNTLKRDDGIERKPAEIHKVNGEVVEAAHYLINTKGWVCVYETARKGGIDRKIPPHRVDEIVHVSESMDESIVQTDSQHSVDEIGVSE